MMKWIMRILSIIIALAGIGIFTYPLASREVARIETRSQLQVFEEIRRHVQDQEISVRETKPVSPAEAAPLLTKMQDYNATLYQDGQAGLLDPFSYYGSSLDLATLGLEEGLIGKITIPAMDLEEPLYLGSEEAVISKGVGHLSYTSLPVGGADTNTVLVAHRGAKTLPMFRDIESLQIGDPIYVTNFWETLTYEVAEIKIIYPDEMQYVYIQPGRDLVTLITCHPYTANYQRYVVFCERIPGEAGPDTMQQTGKKNRNAQNSLSLFSYSTLSDSQKIIWVEHWTPYFACAGLFLFLLVLLLIQAVSIRKRKRQTKHAQTTRDSPFS